MQLSSIQTKNNSYNHIVMFFLIIGAVLLLFLILGDIAYASDATSGGGASLPWEAPLEKLKKSVSGPVAFVVSLLGLVAGGATLIFGGEVSEFVKRIIYLVLVISVIVFANTLLTGALFSGAVIPASVVVGGL
ncbi:TrbC/VirB2 family protein [Bartonella vinsonii]|uniref:TrbC/VirB2 family protein n=1 Tax=Bartonella vinsonii TaxID=33047 RepID=UPI0002B6D3CD|nr:TrbC/VirB2 family protein [Bartonella vinsonii]AGF75409.1 conjugal transfer protein TrbC [Bartonella vinsonii subsp. berkhoffii str. Winnie]